MKKKDFTEEEMQFLLNKIERGTFVAQKESIELGCIDTEFEHKLINGKYYQKITNQHTSISKERTAKKAEIIKAINEADDFQFYYSDDCTGTLITYDSIIEPEEDYLERLRTEGRKLITLEKSRLARISRRETRKVLVEKTKKKNIKIFKQYPVPAVIREQIHYDIDMLLDFDFFHRGA